MGVDVVEVDVPFTWRSGAGTPRDWWFTTWEGTTRLAFRRLRGAAPVVVEVRPRPGASASAPIRWIAPHGIALRPLVDVAGVPMTLEGLAAGFPWKGGGRSEDIRLARVSRGDEPPPPTGGETAEVVARDGGAARAARVAWLRDMATRAVVVGDVPHWPLGEPTITYEATGDGIFAGLEVGDAREPAWASRRHAVAAPLDAGRATRLAAAYRRSTGRDIEGLAEVLGRFDVAPGWSPGPDPVRLLAASAVVAFERLTHVGCLFAAGSPDVVPDEALGLVVGPGRTGVAAVAPAMEESTGPDPWGTVCSPPTPGQVAEARAMPAAFRAVLRGGVATGGAEVAREARVFARLVEAMCADETAAPGRSATPAGGRGATLAGLAAAGGTRGLVVERKGGPEFEVGSRRGRRAIAGLVDGLPSDGSPTPTLWGSAGHLRLEATAGLYAVLRRFGAGDGTGDWSALPVVLDDVVAVVQRNGWMVEVVPVKLARPGDRALGLAGLAELAGDEHVAGSLAGGKADVAAFSAIARAAITCMARPPERGVRLMCGSVVDGSRAAPRAGASPCRRKDDATAEDRLLADVLAQACASLAPDATTWELAAGPANLRSSYWARQRRVQVAPPRRPASSVMAAVQRNEARATLLEWLDGPGGDASLAARARAAW